MPRRLFLLSLPILLLSYPAYSNDNTGFIYGTLTTDEGEEHTGFLRWESEEAYWDDYFDSRQVEAPFFDYIDLDALARERQDRYFASHGLLDRLMYALDNHGEHDRPTRLFLARFGDMAAIDVDHREETITITMNDGREVGVWGYANDVKSDIWIYTGADEPVVVEWDDIARIEFSQAPPGAVPYAGRVYAVVKSRSGDLEGFVMWDESECTTVDVIDADERDVNFGDIAHIRRRNEGGSEVTLSSGETVILTGTNDVDRGHRGVFVEVPGAGRVAVDWKDFQEAAFSTGRGSGPGRDAFPPIAELHGTVTDTEGRNLTGRVVYDADEAWTCDILDGSIGKWTWEIPFVNVASIERTGDPDGIRVRLKSGRILDLDDSQDTGRDNAGLLVFGLGGGDPEHLSWNRFLKVEFGP